MALSANSELRRGLASNDSPPSGWFGAFSCLLFFHSPLQTPRFQLMSEEEDQEMMLSEPLTLRTSIGSVRVSVPPVTFQSPRLDNGSVVNEGNFFPAL